VSCGDPIELRRGEPIELRRVRCGDAAALREIRLRALTDAPAAFATLAQDEAARPPSDWVELAEASERNHDAVMFVAVGPAGWLGMVGVRLFDRDRGVVHLWGMWVDPSARRTGLGERLVAEVHGWAAGRGARCVRLGVIEGVAAEAFYVRLGFTPTGETKALARDESTLARFLSRPV
jgi:GNAT superfamily N-acetyltransferase